MNVQEAVLAHLQAAQSDGRNIPPEEMGLITRLMAAASDPATAPVSIPPERTFVATPPPGSASGVSGSASSVPGSASSDPGKASGAAGAASSAAGGGPSSQSSPVSAQAHAGLIWDLHGAWSWRDEDLANLSATVRERRSGGSALESTINTLGLERVPAGVFSGVRLPSPRLLTQLIKGGAVVDVDRGFGGYGNLGFTAGSPDSWAAGRGEAVFGLKAATELGTPSVWATILDVTRVDASHLLNLVSGLMVRRMVIMENSRATQRLVADGSSVAGDSTDEGTIAAAITACYGAGFAPTRLLLGADLAGAVLTRYGSDGASGSSPDTAFGFPFTVVSGLPPGTAVALDVRGIAVRVDSLVVYANPFDGPSLHGVHISASTEGALSVMDQAACWSAVKTRSGPHS